MRTQRNIFFAMAFFAAMTLSAQSAKVIKYEVQGGETLYSIARSHSVTVAAILEANPGLQADRVMAGQTLLIPTGKAATSASSTSKPSAVPSTQAKAPQIQSTVQPLPRYKATHEVRKKETVYSICRQYGITESELREANPSIDGDKVKKGTVLNIPFSAEEKKAHAEKVRQAEEQAKREWAKKHAPIKVAVILPFNTGSLTMSAESQKMANMYQGFLLAVDSLKQRGVSVDVHAYDEVASYAAVDQILQRPEMSEMQLIVGPVRGWNVKNVAEFAAKNGIVHVAPLANEPTVVDSRPTTFQVNVNSSMLYSQVYNKFYAEHKNDNIVIVNMNEKDDNADFIIGLKAFLDKKGMAYSRTSVNDISSIRSMLSNEKRNIVLPTSGSTHAFALLCGRLDNAHVLNDYRVQLFGYPEWQTLAGKQDAHLRKYRCQFYTTFYSNSMTERSKRFNSLFRRWFNQDQYNSLPRYGELGYDIGAYFIKGIKEYSDQIVNNLHNYSYSSMEFPFNFERKASGSGFQNKSILFVTYRDNGTVTVR